MQSSKKKIVRQLAGLLQQLKVVDIVISPGSRNAPLTIQFSEDKKFNCYSIVDERSAGFFGMGIAQKTRKPVVLCCTSGSATANYYPAITEAFYQNIPLIVLSADRPKKLIDKFDGQTIRQENLFANHINHSVNIDGEKESLGKKEVIEIQKILADCLENQCPIHINISFNEPLYDTIIGRAEKPLTKVKKTVKNIKKSVLTNFEKTWNNNKRKLVLVGLQKPSIELNRVLEKLSNDTSTILLYETTSNLKNKKFIQNVDKLIFNLTKEELEKLKPDLLLTIGQNVVSKKVKSFLRNHKAKIHFHLDNFWQPDTYFSLTNELKYDALAFLKQVNFNTNKMKSDYQGFWLDLKKKRDESHVEYLKKVGFSDLKVFSNIIKSLPKKYDVQISNSSAIRYAQLFNFKKNHNVYCNRGTSGIDGCTGTAIGFAVANAPKPVLLITGDLAFFYDTNSLWNNYIPSNFRIILINNGGGNIFKIIPGPDQTRALDKFFVTKHSRKAKELCSAFGLEYKYADSIEKLDDTLNCFYKNSTSPKLLEINTSGKSNHEILREYFRS